MNPTIAAGLIAAAISIVSFGFNAWTTSRTLQAARAASLRDRQAGVYQQILAFMSHQTETRRTKTRPVRYVPLAEAGCQALIDSYTPPNWFELQASVLAFCPDSVVDAFLAAKVADEEVWVAKGAHIEAVSLNQSDPMTADPDGVAALQSEFLKRVDEAERADAGVIAIVRDKMLGVRPSDTNGSLIGKVIFEVKSRQSLR